MKYLSCLAYLALGCSSVSGATPAIEAKVNVRAQTSDGVPVPGVLLEAAGRQAVSAADGTADLTLSGSEGERREVSVVCPDDYETPASTLVVSIQRSDAARAYNYDVACTPLRRSVVVVTRAVNGANLPILHLGSEIGRTNDAGIAHASVSLPAGEPLRLMLDTDGRDLLPRSPMFDFPAADRDEIVTVNQVFEVPVRPKVSRRPAKKATPSRPTRL